LPDHQGHATEKEEQIMPLLLVLGVLIMFAVWDSLRHLSKA